MKITKTAIAVAISSAFLFGCDFDVGSENSSTGGGNSGGNTPTSELVGPYWNIGQQASTTQSVDLPNVYVFDGSNSHYYDDDATPGIYKITTTPYSDDIDAGTVTFTYYDAGTETQVTGSYTVDGGQLVVDTSSFGKLMGSDEVTNTDIVAAVKAANDASGFNRLVQIRDTSDSARGELRLKLSDSSTDAAVREIQVGKLTVDLTYQDGDTGGAADGNGENAYISLFASGTSNSNLHGEVIFEDGKIKYRDNNGDMIQTGDTFELGEPLEVEASWDETTFSFVVNSVEYGPFPVADTSAVQVISLKIGDTTNTTHFELLADNFKVYNIEGANEELVFEDDFDGYSIGQNLSGNPYNNNSKEAIVVDGSGGSAPEVPEIPEIPEVPGDVTDNFDSYTVGTQIDVANNAYKLKGVDGSEVQAVVSDAQAKSGLNSLYLIDDSGTTKGVVGREFKDGAANTGSVSTSVYVPENGYVKSSYLYLGTDTGASSSKRFTEVVFGSSEISLRLVDPQDSSETVLEPLVKYSQDTWVDVTIGWSGEDVTVTIDGQPYSGYKAHGVSNTPTAFALYNGDNSSVGTKTYFDNLDSNLF